MKLNAVKNRKGMYTAKPNKILNSLKFNVMIKHALLLSFFLSLSIGVFAQKNAAYYIERAQNRMQRQDFQGALRDFNEAVKLEPQNALAYINRGMLNARHLFNKRSALHDFNKAIEISPEQPSGYYNRGALLKDAQDYAAALKDYNKVIELSPNFSGAYYNRATLNYFFINDKKSACNDWKKAEELGHKEATEWISKYCKDAAK